MSNYYGGITGYGKAVPERVVTNEELASKIDTSDQWITERTGIKQRRVVGDHEQCSQLATDSARKAMERAGVSADEIDLIIVATSSPDFLTPPVSSMVQHNLGAKCGAFTMVVGCTGFVSALITADLYMKTGQYRNIIVVGVEVITRMVDWEDRNTCVLFGDGAASVVVSRKKEPCGVLSHMMGSDGSGAELLILPSGGTKVPPSHESLDSGQNYLKMNGREVFKFATKVMGQSIEKVLEDSGLSKDDIDLYIPHQANARIIEFAIKTADLPADRVYINVHKYGNTSAASIPIALCEAFDEGRVKMGDKMVFVAFGAGLTWAACTLQLPE